MVAKGAKMKEQLITRITSAMELHTQHNLLSDWEVGYCESVLDQANKRGKLSEKQLSLLAKVEEKCTPSAIEESVDWSKNYNQNHREDAIICAKYYQKAGYFIGMATLILKDPDFVPTPRSFKKMCANKYAKKVLATAKAKPVFSVGSTVEFRKPALGWSNRHLEGIPCLVIEVLTDVISAASGAKQYSVLPYGEAQPVLAEERQIKKCRHKPASKKKSNADEDILF
jgi:hypothetical protein